MQPAKRKKTPKTLIGQEILRLAAARALAGQKERAEGMMDAVDFFETKLLGNGIVDVGASIGKAKEFVDDSEKALKQPYVAPPAKTMKASVDGSSTYRSSKCDDQLLYVLAQRAPKKTSVALLSFLSGYSQSGSFSAALARLRKSGNIIGSTSELTPDEISRRTGYKMSGSFSAALATLRKCEILNGTSLTDDFAAAIEG